MVSFIRTSFSHVFSWFRIGVRKALLLFSSLNLFGQLVTTIGVWKNSWNIMFLGRFILGLGGESFTVSNTAFMTEWFKGKELALAFGISMAVSKLGSVLNNFLSPVLAHSANISVAFLFGVFLCLTSSIFVLLTGHYDKKMELQLKDQVNYEEISNTMHNNDVEMIRSSSSSLQSREEGEKQLVRSSTHRSYSPITEESSALSSRDERDHDSDESSSSSSSPVQLLDFMEFRTNFWLLLIICFVLYSCILPFNNISASFLLERDYFKLPPDSRCQLLDVSQCQSENNPPNEFCFPGDNSKGQVYPQWFQPPLPHNYSQYNPLRASFIDCSLVEWKESLCTRDYCQRLLSGIFQANSMMSIPYSMSALLSAPAGWLVDMKGYRAVLAIVASATVFLVHLLLGLFPDLSPFWPLVGQGIAYTFFSTVLWASVPLIVENKVTGFAFGIVTCVQNLGAGLMPMAVATIYRLSGDKYIPNVELLFAFLGLLGVVASVFLTYDDYFYRQGVLNKGAEE
jgi:MFS family permease